MLASDPLRLAPAFRFRLAPFLQGKMQNKEDVITAYLNALTRMDGDGIQSLGAPDHPGVGDVAVEKIKKFGWRTFTTFTVDYA